MLILHVRIQVQIKIYSAIHVFKHNKITFKTILDNTFFNYLGESRDSKEGGLSIVTL